MDFSPEQKAELNRCYVHRSAMHEAGHALSIWYHDTLGLVPDNWPIGEVVVRPDPDRPLIIGDRDFEADGVTSRKRLLWRDEAYRSPPLWPHPDGIEWPARELRHWHRITLQRRMAELTTIYAGPIAEAFYHDEEAEFDEQDWSDTIDHWEPTTDWRSAQHAVSKLGRRWRLHSDRAWDRATRIVRGHPNHIEALAAALIERNVVEGDEAFDIFDAAGQPIRLNRLQQGPPATVTAQGAPA
jgi:hypothetical protein